jgi:hypothetical protein
MTPQPTGSRLVRHHRQTLHAAPERVFPLLCPVREQQWLPGFRARMIHSVSGVAEPGAVFATPQDTAPEVIWTTVEHARPRRVRFVRWHPGEMVVDLELDLSAGTGLTWLDVRYTYTAISPAGDARVQAMTEPQWIEQMTHWETTLNAWLAAHTD